MCNPISLVMHPDRILTPPLDAWSHSHEAMARAAGLTVLQADRWAKVEVRPPGDVFRDPTTNDVLPVTDEWRVVVDEEREPDWWSEDRPAQEARARAAAAKWLAAFPHNIIPKFCAIGGNESTLTGGDGSTLTGGYRSTLTGGYRSTLTGGDESTLTGGDGSTLTGGYRSTLTGGYRSTLTWRVWDSTHRRIHVAYVGEDGIEPGVAYTFRDGKIVKAK